MTVAFCVTYFWPVLPFKLQILCTLSVPITKGFKGKTRTKTSIYGASHEGPPSAPSFVPDVNLQCKVCASLSGNGWLCLDTGSHPSFPPCPFPPVLNRWEMCVHTYTHTHAQMHKHLAHHLEQLLAVTKYHVCILRKTLAFRIQLASEYTQMVFMF